MYSVILCQKPQNQRNCPKTRESCKNHDSTLCPRQPYKLLKKICLKTIKPSFPQYSLGMGGRDWGGNIQIPLAKGKACNALHLTQHCRPETFLPSSRIRRLHKHRHSSCRLDIPHFFFYKCCAQKQWEQRQVSPLHPLTISCPTAALYSFSAGGAIKAPYSPEKGYKLFCCHVIFLPEYWV
ncbi:hypothetical protein FKM82_017505 [Ascaphus truei]